jgi:hypothetical protein
MIIQTRLDGDRLEVFALAPPKGMTPVPLPKEALEADYLAQSAKSEVLSRDGNGNLFRLYSTWNMETDVASGGYGIRSALDGGDGLYISDFGLFARSITLLPTQDGSYSYVYTFANEKGTSYRYTYVYTKTGTTATLTLDGQLVYNGTPISSSDLGMGILVASFFGQASEAVQDQRYTGTWTVSENFNGVIDETGRFDMRRLGLRNLRVDPPSFNPLEVETATITADIVALPATTSLTPNGWTPSGGLKWLVQFDDPLRPRTPVFALSGTVTPTTPDTTTGKIGQLNATWDGKDGPDGQYLLNATYPVRAQALGTLGFGNVVSKEVASSIQLGALGVRVLNLGQPRNPARPRWR